MKAERPYSNGKLVAADGSYVPCQYRLESANPVDSDVYVPPGYHGELKDWFLRDNLPAYVVFVDREDGPGGWGFPVLLALSAMDDLLTITVAGLPQRLPAALR